MFSLFHKKSAQHTEEPAQPASPVPANPPVDAGAAPASPGATPASTTAPNPASLTPASSSPPADPTAAARDETLQKLTKDLAEKIDELHQTKAATLNLLEDSLGLEQELKVERDRIKAIIASMGDGLVVVDKYCKITSINPVGERMLETTSVEAMEENWNSLIKMYHGTRELLMDDRPVNLCLTTGQPVLVGLDDDIYVQTLSGKRFPISIAITPLSGHGVTGAVIVFRDISQEKEAKRIIERTVEERTKQLKEERARLEASINSLNVGFIMTDVQLNIITINSVAKRILYAQAENGLLSAENTRWMDFPFTMEYVENQLKDSFHLIDQLHTKCLTEKKTVEFRDIPFRDLFLRIFLSPILIVRSELEVIGTLVVIENTTEAKVIERSKDEFFSIASHELRTPLTAIRGNTSLIQQFYSDKLQDKDLKDMISDIHESSIRLIAIVNDFLDLSRLEQKKIEFHSEPFAIEALIIEILKEFQGQVQEKQIHLSYEKPEHPLSMVYSDKNRMKQVLMNLIGNSIKFTEKGGVRVETAETPTAMRVLVHDTGKGISAKNQHLLFRKFQQAGDSLVTRDTTKGTGLGLYISKLMMESMGGNIGLEKSEEGKGSTFFVSIPLAKTHTKAAPKQSVGIPQVIQDVKQQREESLGPIMQGVT